MKTKLLTTFAALSTVLLVTQNPAFANTFTNQVKSQLLAIAQRVNGSYQATHTPVIDQMEAGADDDYTVNLRSGISYAIVAVCDEDCSDLDLGLYDSRGNLVASDTDDDDLPVVQVNPRWTGKFTIRTKMAQCSSNPCYYGVGVFAR